MGALILSFVDGGYRPAPIPLRPLGIDDYVAQTLFVGDIVLDEVSKALALAVHEHGAKFLDLAVAFVEAGAHSIPFGCFRPAQSPMPSRPSALIAGLGILHTTNCLGLRRMLCGLHQGRSHPPK